MKIIVTQRHEINLSLIKTRLEILRPGRSKEIIFISSLDEVLEEVAKYKNERIIVISGQILGLGAYGTDLARQVKLICPDALFFICSVMPAINDFVDGVIPKIAEDPYQSPFSLLVRVLADDLENFTVEHLKIKYPQIKNKP